MTTNSRALIWTAAAMIVASLILMAPAPLFARQGVNPASIRQEDALIRQFSVEDGKRSEAKALRASAGRASRKGLVLTIHLGSGRKLRLRDEDCKSGWASCRTYRLVAHAATRGVFVILDGWGEGDTYSLIDERTGQLSGLFGRPSLSKSGQTAAGGGNSDMGNDIPGIVIFTRAQDIFRRSWIGAPQSCFDQGLTAFKIDQLTDEMVQAHCWNEELADSKRVYFVARRNGQSWALPDGMKPHIDDLLTPN